MRRLIYLFLLCSIPFYAESTNYYISYKGSDSKDGKSRDKAWATIDKLNQAAQSGLISSSSDSIFFERGGVYYGQTGGEILRASYIGAYGAGEMPVVDGTKEVPKNWTNLSGNIWRIAFQDGSSPIRFLFRDNVSLPLGRYPNNEWLIYENPSGSRQITDNDLNFPDHYWDGANIAVKTSRWTIDDLPVTSQIGKKVNVAMNPTYSFYPGFGYFFQNHPKTLDMEGEWCFRNDSIYLYTTENPNNHNFRVSYLRMAFNLYNNTYKIENIKIFGYNTDAVDGEESRLTVRNCTFEYIGNTGISFLYGNNLIVENNTFENILNNGMYYIDVAKTRVSNNTFKNIGMTEGRGGTGNEAYSAILQMGGSDHMINNNHLENIGYTGINFFLTDSVKVLNNYINGACIVKDDGGAIYTWTDGDTTGRDRGQIIKGNIVNNVWGNRTGLPDEMNYYSEAYAIYIDDRKVGINISDNILMNSEYGLFIHHSQDITVNNNVIYNCNEGIMLRQYGGFEIRGCVITNNKILNKSTDINYDVGFTLRLDAVSIQDAIPDNNTFDKNYYMHPFTNGKYIFVFSGSDVYDYNLTGWKSTEHQDMNAKEEPLKWNSGNEISKDDFVYFEYAEKNSKTVYLLGTYVDINNNPVSGKQIIQPYSYLLLFKTSNESVSETIGLTGQETVCDNIVSSEYTLDSGNDFDNYFWVLSPESAGTVETENANAIIRWDEEFTGEVILTAYGCTEASCTNKSNDLTINRVASPVANFEMDRTDKTVTFDNLTYEYDNLLWEFGDGESSSQSDPVHEYANYGNYAVILTAVYNGCEASKSREITLEPDITSVDEEDKNQLSLGDILITPDNDGLNDHWDLTEMFRKYPDAVIKIYNLGATLVYIITINNPSFYGYDFNGNELPTGNYIYSSITKSIRSENSGHLVIIR